MSWSRKLSRMKKFRLLLLDANIVIQLFEQELWNQFIEKCDVLLSRIVIEQEANYFETDEGRTNIDLSKDVKAGRITVVDAPLAQVDNFKKKFVPSYLDRFDAGELESLVFLENSKDKCLISSADSIVFRVLGCLDKSDQGISLEEVLDKIGLSRKLPPHYGRRFREHWTAVGASDRIQGFGLV